jgi:hypothetical protein
MERKIPAIIYLFFIMKNQLKRAKKKENISGLIFKAKMKIYVFKELVRRISEFTKLSL